MNNYLNEINTKILKRKYVSNKTHLVAKNNICLDYKKYNIEKEEIFINNSKVVSIYDSNLGPVYIVDFKPNNDNLHITLNYDKRIRILKSLSTRILIKSVLSKYLGLSASNFYTSINESYFDINQIFFEDEADKIKSLLNKNINEYIKYALDIIHDESKKTTKIEGLISTKYFPHTVSNLSELNSFNIYSYKIENSKIRFFYNVI